MRNENADRHVDRVNKTNSFHAARHALWFLAPLITVAAAVGAGLAPPGLLGQQHAAPTAAAGQRSTSSKAFATHLAAPPPTRADNLKETLNGIEVLDPYRWLEDQTSAETRSWIDSQNHYTESILRNLAGRQAIEQRLTELMKVDSVNCPFQRHGRYFFLKRRADQDLAVLYLRQGLGGSDQVLVDPHPLSADHSTSVNLAGFSDDGAVVAYSVRQGGEDETTIHLLDATSRKDLPDVLPRADYFLFGGHGVAFKADNSGFYYSRMTSEGPRVSYHAMGTDPARDAEVFGKGYGKDKLAFGELSDGGRYLIFSVFYGAGTERSEIYYQDLQSPGPIRPVVNDIPAFFDGSAAGDTLFLRTNWNAPNWRVLAVNLKDPAREHWREIIAESDAPVEQVDLAGGKLLVLYTRNAASQMKLFEPTGKPAGEVKLPALGRVSEWTTRWGSDEIFYKFNSFHIPPTIYRSSVAHITPGGTALASPAGGTSPAPAGSQEVWSAPSVPIQSDQFEVKQVWYDSKDKTRVPMFLFHRKGIRLDGSNPTLLTGYGGFGVSETPGFSNEAVLWAERGGVWALPNLRGGGEFGEAWHHAGMLDKKQNVFDDFISAAEWLIQNHYTQPGKLAIQGASNGGLLVGAALTQRPDLFQAVVCMYPLLDMVRYHKFLVARWWVPEYGSADDPQQFKSIYAYSPYHHVQPGVKYPAVLLVTGDSDTRVAPLHARKMAARLQAATASGRPILLLYDTKSGHSGGRPLSKQIEENTDILSFLLWQTAKQETQ